MAGMFRGGHRRPTFDTPVEFIAVNQSATDRSGGYGSPQTTWGEWGAPEVLTEQTIPTGQRDDFVPTGDSGAQATNIGMFVWYIESDNEQILLFQRNTSQGWGYKIRGGWFFNNITMQDYYGKDIDIENASANRSRNPIPTPQIIRINRTGNADRGLPNISYDGIDDRYGILIDDATGQSLYYCNDELTPPRCEKYRRAISDPILGPASRTYMADVKDIASAERVVGDIAVAVRTKSLVFAHATLKPLLDAEGSIAKDWKVRIDGRDMDITGVMDGWVPNQYTRLVVEDRS